MNRWRLIGVFCVMSLLGGHTPGRSLIGYDSVAPPQDSVQLQLIDNQLVAVRGASPFESFALSLDEQVLTMESRGSVAAVITSNRFLVISETSAGWLESAFNLNEGYSGELVLSENMVAMKTQDRVVGFDGVNNTLVAFELPVGEQVFQQAAGLNVLVFATEYRAAGLAAGGEWTVLDFDISEIFRSLSAGADAATVQTSTRLLTFSAETGNWSTP
jgi:hypothetical protein